MKFDKIIAAKELTPEAVDHAARQTITAAGMGSAVSDFEQALAEANGVIATADDYCSVPHLLLEDQRLLLPDPVPNGHKAIRERLERMVHAPRNPQVVSTFLKAASREEEASTIVDGRKATRTERRPLVGSLETLARRLAGVQAAHPAFVRLLLRGELGSAIASIPAGGWRDLPEERALSLVRDLAVMWSLHDLQIIAARLHWSIWQTTGIFARAEPRPATVGTVCASVKEIRRALNAVHAAFGRNHRPMNATEHKEWKWFIGFVKQHDLKAVARAHAQEMGIGDDEADADSVGCPKLMAKLRDLLVNLERRVGRPIGDGFEAMSTVKVHTPAAVAEWMHRRQNARKGQLPAKPPIKKALATRGVAQVRYGMQPTFAMAYAVTRFVHTMDRIEETIAAVRKGHRFSTCDADCPRAAFAHARGRTISALLTVYRAAILRDFGHLQGARDTPSPANEAIGKTWSSEHPLLPPTGEPLTEVDATLGRGVSLEDKLPGLDPFSYDLANEDSSQADKRPGRKAITAANALLEHAPLDPRLDLSLGWRLEGVMTS